MVAAAISSDLTGSFIANIQIIEGVFGKWIPVVESKTWKQVPKLRLFSGINIDKWMEQEYLALNINLKYPTITRSNKSTNCPSKINKHKLYDFTR